MPCSIDGCAKKKAARGWCDMHYYRWRNYGDPLTLGPRGARGDIIADPVDRFWSKVRRTETCWLWEGPRARRGGYASITVSGRTTKLVHRVSYEWARGPIPDELVLDHLCMTTNCVNPDHLEPVTIQENSRRASKGRYQAACGQGHPMEGDNVARRSDGARYCRECAREAQRARRQRYRAERRARDWLAATEGETDPRIQYARRLIADITQAPALATAARKVGELDPIT